MYICIYIYIYTCACVLYAIYIYIYKYTYIYLFPTGHRGRRASRRGRRESIPERPPPNNILSNIYGHCSRGCHILRRIYNNDNDNNDNNNNNNDNNDNKHVLIMH